MPTGRSRTYKTEGIILRRRNMGEADSIFTVFSPDRGEVRRDRTRRAEAEEPDARPPGATHADARAAGAGPQPGRLHPGGDGRRTARSARTWTGVRARSTARNSSTASRLTTRPPRRTLRAAARGCSRRSTPAPPLTVAATSSCSCSRSRATTCSSMRAPSVARACPRPRRSSRRRAGGLVCDACRSSAGDGRMLGVRAIKVLRFAACAIDGPSSRA